MQIIYLILISFILFIVIRLLFRKTLDLPGYKGQMIADNSGIGNLMEEERFWAIIDMVRLNSKGNYRYQCELLTQYLDKFSSQEIIQFDRTFSVLLAKTFSFKLWEAAYALNGGCSDDGFEFFRSWLIAQGKNKFYWTNKFPRLLLLIGVKDLIEHYEGFGMSAFYAYENKTGSYLPKREGIKYNNPGTKFSEGLAFLKYPELALLAW